MLKKLILKDALGMWVLLTGCLFGGIVLNEVRPFPLPLVYTAPADRLDQAVEKIPHAESALVRIGGDVNLDEMRNISANRSALILDARPEVFYRIGHIPSALSLPRDDFERRYSALRSTLQAQRGKVIVVYCAGTDCQDSEMVAKVLNHLGYPDVRLFRGGWGDWEGGNLPEEKQ